MNKYILPAITILLLSNVSILYGQETPTVDTLQPKQLSVVTISAQKNAIETTAGKIIVNVRAMDSSMVASTLSSNIPSFYTNFGVSHKMVYDTTTVRLSVNDPFYTYFSGSNTDQPYLTTSSKMRSNSRYCTMSVSYNFGLRDARIQHKRNSTDEARRM